MGWSDQTEVVCLSAQVIYDKGLETIRKCLCPCLTKRVWECDLIPKESEVEVILRKHLKDHGFRVKERTDKHGAKPSILICDS